MNFLNKVEGLGQGHDEGFEDWDSKKCPGAMQVYSEAIVYNLFTIYLLFFYYNKKKLFHLGALKTKQDLVKLQQQTECSAEAEKVSACNQQAKERFVSNDQVLPPALKHQHRREKLLEVGADSPDGRANFAKRVVIKHFH